MQSKRLRKLVRTPPVQYCQDFAAVIDGRNGFDREVREPDCSPWSVTSAAEDALSHVQLSLCRRAVWLDLCLEREETRIAEQGIQS